MFTNPLPAQRRLVDLLAFAAGLTVANVYYNQPLLAAIQAEFRVSSSIAGELAVATQLGYASGLLILVPLGDRLEKRGLIVYSTLGASVMLLVIGLSPNLTFAIFSSFLLGIISITPQLIVPYAANLAEPQNRGRLIGKVMGGLLLGILFSRSVGGFLESAWGWRTVFYLASGLNFLLAIVLRLFLPIQMPPQKAPSYVQLFGSLFPLIRRSPILRRHSLIGALGFSAFAAFWTTLAFYLKNRPEHYGGEVIGLFGLVAIMGAMTAPIAGWFSDRYGAWVVNGTSLVLMAASFVMMSFADTSLVWLVIGVLLMDAGTQGNQISNQTRIYRSEPEMRNRITSIYMSCYFLGGALGSALGTVAWTHGSWAGVCDLGALLALIAILPLIGTRNSNAVGAGT